jgi:hypothetical protein
MGSNGRWWDQERRRLRSPADAFPEWPLDALICSVATAKTRVRRAYLGQAGSATVDKLERLATLAGGIGRRGAGNVSDREAILIAQCARETWLVVASLRGLSAYALDLIETRPCYEALSANRLTEAAVLSIILATEILDAMPL